MSESPAVPAHPPSLHALDHSNNQQTWQPILTEPFPFAPSSFLAALEQMSQHPEHNTSWILRSDTLYDSTDPSSVPGDSDIRKIQTPGYAITRTLTRRFIPRNPQRDAYAEQTIHFLTGTDLSGDIRELVVYLNHCDTAEGTPYYLPKVRGVAWLLTPLEVGEGEGEGERKYKITLLYSLFTSPPDERLKRTALHLLARATKLAAGIESGYIKRVHHDLVVKREGFQDRYLALKAKHAARLVEGWRERTDPKKHVFEDILIATFLVCLWEGMYPGKKGWVGFADIGCGNGVLVDILIREGWSGCGFDLRARKSWGGFCEETQAVLKERILVPFLLGDEPEEGDHDGRFQEGTFIISNHADELTPWTPLLAAANRCPFLAIPCCSHNLSGAKKRFPPPKELEGTETKGDLRLNMNLSKSTYASLCAYVEGIAKKCGWAVEREILRIPSTRNVGIIGRKLVDEEVDIVEVLQSEGGGDGWRIAVAALKKKEAAGH
jgi:tRNASer (uridine44-2'-O)-methyltransferase